jgi:hypothetical protein
MDNILFMEKLVFQKDNWIPAYIELAASIVFGA